MRADGGYHIVHTVLQAPVPFVDGFALIDTHLSAIGRPRAALCGVELRCATPYTADQWVAPDGFNAHYIGIIRSWGLFVGEHNPVARTNVAPTVSPPAEQVLYGFSYTAPAALAGSTFVLSGAGESPRVRAGETGSEALREKLADVVNTLERRLTSLAAAWEAVTTINLYAAHDLYPLFEQEVLLRLGPAAVHGIHLFPSRPPIDNLEIELDVRAVEEERRLR